MEAGKETSMEPTKGALTPRQKQVVILIAEDLTTAEIGKRLGIDRRTVEYHRVHIKEVLGVAGTAGIVRYAIKAGLIQL